jgi:hypothetical protein
LRHFGHGAYQLEIWVALFQLLKSIEKRGIFGSPVGTEEMQLVREPVVIGLSHDAEKGCDSDSTSQKHSRLE